MKTPELAIQKALKNQLEACLEVMMDSILGHYFDRELGGQILKDAHGRGELFVCAEGREVQGFYVCVSRSTFLVFPYLHLLAVRTLARGKGIGSRLLQHLEKTTLEGPGYPFRPKVFLLVAQDNPRAVKFYEQNGYSRQAVFENMFGEGDTELLMMKDLGLKKELE